MKTTTRARSSRMRTVRTEILFSVFVIGSLLIEDALSFAAVIELLSPYNAGADGLVVWGATVGAQGGPNWMTYVDYIRSSTGPLIAGFEREVTACSQARCSGHGRCTAVAADPARLGAVIGEGADGECECFDGFAGPMCATEIKGEGETYRGLWD